MLYDVSQNKIMKKYQQQWRKFSWMELKRVRDETEESFASLENADPELCIKFLQFPSVHNFYGIRKKIETSDDEWMQEFLHQNGLVQLFDTLERISEQSSREANILNVTELAQCVNCLKSIMDSKPGLDFVTSHKNYSKLLSKTLCSKSTAVKSTVFRLLAAMHVYSSDGKKQALDTLENYKIMQSQRCRFSIVVNDLKSSKNNLYKTTLLMYINAVIWSAENLRERIRLRNEMIGLNLLDILSDIRDHHCDELLEQTDIFFQYKLQDDKLMKQLFENEEFDMNDHKDVFFALFNQICNTPQAETLLTILQCLLQLDPKEATSGIAWKILEQTIQQIVVIETEEEGKRVLRNCGKYFQFSRTVEMPEVSNHLSSYDDVDGSIGTSDGEFSGDEVDGLVSTSEEVSDGDEVDGLDEHSNKNINLEESCALTSTDNSTNLAPGASAASILFLDKPPAPLHSSSPATGGPPPPPPPPPPSSVDTTGTKQNSESRRTVKVPKPDRKLRKLNWVKLDSNIVKKRSGSVWNCLEKNGYEVEANYQAVGTLFAQKIAEKNFDKEKKCETSKPAKVVSLIDSRLSLNVGIFLKQFRMPVDEIVKALENGNENVLSAQKYKGMQKYLPESSDIDLVQEFKGDVNSLSNVDKYYLLLSKLPNYEMRIHLGLARATFNDDFSELTSRYQSIKKACQGILNSENLKKFLLLVLKIGNYLNYGSRTGSAYGFNISSLLKLSDTKSNNAGTSLLDCIVVQAKAHHPSLLELPNEMQTVIHCKGMSLEQTTNEMRKFASKIKNLDKKAKNSSDHIKSQFKEFLKHACGKVSLFDKDIKEIEKLSANLAEYFAEDPKKFKWDECILTLVEFFEQFSDAIQKMKEKEAKAEKEKKREDRKLKNVTENDNRRTEKSSQQKNMIEDLLKSMLRDPQNPQRRRRQRPS